MVERILLTNIKELKGILTKPHSLKKGEAMSVVSSIPNAFLLIQDGKIADFGPMTSDMDIQADQIMDVSGKMVLPCWCDSHTHIVFAGSREGEYVDRIKGMSYEEIARRGGGILNSAKRLRETSEEELYLNASQRLEEVIGFGTGAIEIKSGYGLSLESELKILRVIKMLKENYPTTIKSTFLGAHAIPEAYKSDRKSYIDLVINQMLPAVADESLADYCDVFCDDGFFTVEETDLILKAAAKYGLKPKIHANELANSGGVQIGIANNAISVDHLEAIEDKEIEALLDSNTIPTVLPSVSYFLNITYAPARRMIDKGLGVAIASDYNPGSTPSGKIPFALSLACNKMRLLPEEAFNAATINGAYAMECHEELGSITRGKIANLIITKEIPSLAYIPYAFGSDHISEVLLRGKPYKGNSIYS